MDGPIFQITASSSSNANLFVYLCKDPNFFGVIGLAWVGSLCVGDNLKGYRTSINEKRENAVATAEVVAHEMGHNLGMLHDFDEQNGGENGACNGEGLMSYGNVPQKWSSCSQANYLAHYNQFGGNNWCMPGKVCKIIAFENVMIKIPSLQSCSKCLCIRCNYNTSSNHH